jgi:hypothetical protein
VIKQDPATTRLLTLYAPHDREWTVQTIDGPVTLPPGSVVKLDGTVNGWRIQTPNNGCTTPA